MVETPGRITLWGIEVFVATVDEQSVSAAARRLGASPSAVSQQLTNLETAVGATLLDRSARPVRLTPAGEIFRRRAQSILNEAEQARAELAMADLSSLTRFRLGMIEDFDADVTPRLLSEMSETLKSCQFLLDTGASHRLFDQLDARALDVIVAADLGIVAEWMQIYPLMEEPFVVALPKGRIKDPKAPKSALQGLPLIQYTSRHHMGRQIAAHLSRQNLTLARRFELDSYHAIMAMVAQGAGWTILTPLGLMRAQRFRDQVDVIPLPFEPLSRQITLVARQDALGGMPGDMAGRLKPILHELIIDPIRTRMPWLQDTLRLL